MDPNLPPSPNNPQDEAYFPLDNYRIQRSHRHTTSLGAIPRRSPNPTVERGRSATLAPSLPPKQGKPPPPIHKDLLKSYSLDNKTDSGNISPPKRVIEDPYISVNDIATFPEGGRHRPYQSTTQQVLEDKESRPPPLAKGIRPRQSSPNSMPRITAQSLRSSGSRTISSPTRLRANTQSDNLYTLPQKEKHFRPISPQSNPASLSPQFLSNEPFNFAENRFQSSTATTAQYGNQDNYNANFEPPAVPVAKKECTFANDFNRIQNRLFRLYRKIQETPEDSPLVKDIKIHLRLTEHDSVENVLEKIHMSLAPPQEEDIEKKMMYVIDFRSFRDKFDLRHQIIEMFAKPGPPSVSYAKVDAKMDSIITEFCNRVVQLREIQGKLIESPANARMILQGVTDGEQLVKALRENQLWIRWGTVSNLPPLNHLYMHKHPPSYEVRKAVTISFIAERLKAMPDMMNNAINANVLCPPIYSRLKSETGKNRWQVTEYNISSGKFEAHESQFPSWLDDEPITTSLLNSSNRTTFPFGEHPYALYAVYVVIIKDFSLAQDGAARINDKEFSWAVPSKIQYYIGSSSTGVIYRFAHVENNHCDRIWKVLSEATSLRHYRCYEGCDLVEACLALAWARHQPRAVFVLNSFLPSSMSSLSLEQKAPFKEKMLTLASHLTDGKKLGSLCDMRYGMNGTTTIQEEEEY